MHWSHSYPHKFHPIWIAVASFIAPVQRKGKQQDLMPSLQNAAPGAKSSKIQGLNPFTPFLVQPVGPTVATDTGHPTTIGTVLHLCHFFHR